MEFLKRHYEKLILAVLLLVFIFSMLYLLYIIKSTSDITAKDLELPTREADFKVIAADDPSFDMGSLLAVGRAWKPSVPRDPRFTEFSSDLVVAFPIARCGNCRHLVPLAFFSGKKCPYCEVELPEPTIIHAPPPGKGIPQEVKVQYGDPNMHELDDMDSDGFSNLYEYEQKTRLNDPRSRPELWHRLVLSKIDRVKLPFMLMKVNTNNSEEKARWDVQINRLDTDRTVFTSLNDVIKIDDSDYRIADIELKHTQRKVGSDTVTDDQSIIRLEMVGGDRKIQMQVGKDVFSPEPKAFLSDLGEPSRVITVDVGMDFALGKPLTGRETYRVKSVDQKVGEQKVFLIYRTRNRSNFNKEVPEPITRDGKIPVDQRVRPQGFGGGGMDMMF